MCSIKKIEDMDFEKPIPFFIFIFVITILSLTPPRISNDSPLYLSIALNIYKGLGPIMPDGQLFIQKPPLFLYLIAFVFKIFSPSVISASLIPRFFGALNVILIYLLGLRLISNRTGAFLGATLFFSSQFIMNYNAWIQYESTLLFFQILWLLLMIDAFEKGSRLLLLFSAVAVVCGFYIKQTSLVLIPVPMIIWLFFNKVRLKIKFYNLAFFYIPFLILVVPWYFYIAKMSQGALGDYQEYQKVLLLIDSFKDLSDAFKSFIYNRLFMEMSKVEIILLSFGFIYLVGRTLKKSLPHAVLLTAWLLVFLSMFPALIQGWQIRHIITSIALSLVAMGDFFGHFLGKILPIKIYPLIRKLIIIFCTAFLMIGFLRLESWHLRRYDETFNKKSFSCECIKYISTFINGNIPSGSKIMSCWLYSYMVYFYTSGDYPMFLLPFERINISDSESKEINDGVTLSQDFFRSDINNKKVIFSVGLEKEKRFYLRGNKNVLYEDDFLSFLKQNDIDYVLYVYHETRSPRELEDYLNEKTLFERIFYRDYASIYRVKNESDDLK